MTAKKHQPDDMSMGQYLREAGWRKGKDGLWRSEKVGGSFLTENALKWERDHDPDTALRTVDVRLTLNGEALRSVLSTLDDMAKDMIQPEVSNASGNRAAAHLLLVSAAIEEAFEQASLNA